MHNIDYKDGLPYYGVVNHLLRQITINEGVVPSRRAAAILHEGIHAIERKFDIKIPHQEVVGIANIILTLIPKIKKLRSGTWRLNMSTIPIKIVHDKNGKGLEDILAEMIGVEMAFYKYKLTNPFFFDLFARMAVTFSLKARTFNEETGEYNV